MLCSAVESLLTSTSIEVLNFIVPRFSKCLQRILDEPLDLKLQSVRLDKFYRKSGVPKKDAHSLFEVLRFEIKVEDGHPVAKLSPEADIELLRCQKHTMEAAYARHAKMAKRRR